MIYVECEDPRVLVEHQQAGGEVQQVWAEGRSRAGRAAVEDFRHWIGVGHRYRLVFEDAEAAGRGLAHYTHRLGARVDSFFEGDVLRVRIAAPVAPSTPEAPDRQERCSDEPACGCAWCEPLPTGTPVIGWTAESSPLPILLGEYVPKGWERCVVEQYANAPEDRLWHDRSSGIPTTGVAFVARPVLEPDPPATERVPLGEALSDEREVDWCGDGATVSPVQSAGWWNGALSVWSGTSCSGFVHPARDGLVEVLVRDEGHQ